MKKFNLLVLVLFTGILASFGQRINLNTNGYDLSFQTIDTLFYSEYTSAGNISKTAGAEFNTARLKYSLGKIQRTRNEFSRVEVPVFSTNFYVYTDGTLQAPTTQLFLQPVDAKSFLRRYGYLGRIEEHEVFKGYYYLYIQNDKIRTGDAVFSLCKELVQNKAVVMVEPVFIRLPKVVNPFLPFQWNVANTALVNGGVNGADMNVNGAWNLGATGAGIRVAVIDDGVELTHPDLQANLLPGFDATGLNSGGAPLPINSHGTNCAGIIAAVNNLIGVRGVANNAQIIPIRLGTTAGGSFSTNDTWIANCFNQAVTRGAHVISNSWGGGSPSTQISNAIDNAVNNGRGGLGSVVLFSAGNNNSSISYPSTKTNVIAVGASTPCDTRKRSSSNAALVGPGVQTDPLGTSCDGEAWWGSNFGTGLDIMAPGVLIPSTDNMGPNGADPTDYNIDFNGTSAACPNAAAVTALILSVNPNLTGIQARNILETTTNKVGGYNYQAAVAGQPNGTWSTDAGYGRINACDAVIAAFRQRLSITGNTFICNSSDYRIDNLPPGAVVTWSIPAGAGSVLQLAQNTPVTNQLRITNQKWYTVATTLTATITNLGCGNNTIVLTKAIENDNSATGVVGHSYYQEACMAANVPHPSNSGTIYSNSSPVFVHQGCMVYVNLGNMAGRTVTVSGGTPLFWSVGSTIYYPNTLYFQLPIGSGGVPFTFNINGSGQCTQRSLLFFSFSNNARYAFAANPNPVKTELTVTAEENTRYLAEKKLSSTKQNLQLTIKIYDLNTNTLQITQRSARGNMQHTINVANLKKGYYVLQINDGEETQTIKFLKE